MSEWQRDLIIPFIIIVFLPFLLASTLVSASPVDDLGEMERQSRALELFLQDKVDYKKWCPDLKWDQPEISIYKEKLESQLPEGCIPAEAEKG
jgi:hypothetical protein